MRFFSKIRPLLIAYRRTNWEVVSLVFLLSLASVQVHQVQQATQDINALKRLANGSIFDLYAIYYPVSSYDDGIMAELKDLRDRLVDIDEHMDLTTMYFSNQALEFGSGKPVLLIFSSELENEIMVSPHLNFTITEQMLADVNLTGYSIQYTEGHIPTDTQLYLAYPYVFTKSHFISTFSKEGVNFTSYNFMVLPWQKLPILEQLPVVGNASFAEFWGPWNGEIPQGSGFRKKVKDITQQVTREVQLFTAESKSNQIIYNILLDKNLAKYENENWFRILESIGIYSITTAMLVGLLVLSIREQRRQLEKTVDILNLRGYDRKRSSSVLFGIFMTNIVSLGSLVILMYFIIWLLETRTDRLIIGINDYILMNLSILTVLMAGIAAICWKLALKVSLVKMLDMLSRTRGTSKSPIPQGWLGRNGLKLLAGIILLLVLLPLVVSWTRPSSSMNDMLPTLMASNGLLVVVFYREIPAIKIRRFQVIGTVVKRPSHLVAYRSVILVLLLFLSVAGLARHYEYKGEEAIPGDIAVSPISSHDLFFPEVENLNTLDEINQAVPYASMAGYIGTDLTTVMVIDFDALARLIATSKEFTQRVYQPLFAKDVWSQRDINDVIVTGPLAVKMNLQVNDDLKITLENDDRERFEAVVKVGAITSGIFTGIRSDFSKTIFLSKDLYMKLSNKTEANIHVFGYFLDVRDDLQSAEELDTLFETIRNSFGTKFLAQIHMNSGFDPRGRIAQQNGWSYGSAYLMLKQELENNYILNHFWFFMVLLPAATVLLNIIDVETLAVLHQRGLNKKRFLEQYRRAELIGVMLSALSIGVAYFSWRVFWLLNGLQSWNSTTHPSIPWLFERELLKVIAWSLGYAMVGGGIIYVNQDWVYSRISRFFRFPIWKVLGRY
ncbi:MAG: hypothetical protein D6732_16920 [Methanobacteriota archaeon]|nr:MAG: hypothetical protein D6732_16920 [Euryarchaeota archaeon]